MIGLGSMIGAGILRLGRYVRGRFWVVVGLAVAAVVAYCNAISSAGRALPGPGAIGVYGRMRLGDFWGYLAGWGFVVGKTASCAASGVDGRFACGPRKHAVVVAVVALTGELRRCQSAWLTRVDRRRGVGGPTAVAVAAYGPALRDPARPRHGCRWHTSGDAAAAGLPFSAFAG